MIQDIESGRTTPITAREVEFISRIRHLCWCVYQLAVKQEFNIEPTVAQLKSLQDGVKWALNHPDNLRATSEDNHNNWMSFKLAEGWVYGPVKDAQRKTHPDLVSYEELPEVERAKDDMDMTVQRSAEQLYKQYLL